MDTQFTIRKLSGGDWEDYRSLRLRALKEEPGVFFMTYEEELQYAPRQWQGQLSNPNKAFFGVYDGNKIIGITGVFQDSNDPSGKTAGLGASYILPEYRGQGISALFYEARLQWAAQQPQLQTVLVSHRKSNEASRRANQKFGFVYTGTKVRTWPDGTVEDELFYKLNLDSLRSPSPQPSP